MKSKGLKRVFSADKSSSKRRTGKALGMAPIGLPVPEVEKPECSILLWLQKSGQETNSCGFGDASDGSLVAEIEEIEDSIPVRRRVRLNDQQARLLGQFRRIAPQLESKSLNPAFFFT